MPGQLLYSALHGTAMRYAAERPNLDESIEELRDIADGRNDILAQAAAVREELTRFTRAGLLEEERPDGDPRVCHRTSRRDRDGATTCGTCRAPTG